ncbi:hypothetical protein GF318_01505 [Candidatus Micrarchaeota archaeon]|nr:hypothetical protein [Candidatus Micrarchaeota archaeon]
MRLLMVLLVASCLAFAQSTEGSSGTAPDMFQGELAVEKTAPENVGLNGTFSVRINIANQENSGISAVVTEYLGNVEPVSPLPNYTQIANETMYAAAPPTLTWSVDIPAGGNASIVYSVKPRSVGPLSIGPTSVAVQGTTFFSNSLIVHVACTSSPVCNESIGETPLTCPEKCGHANMTPPRAPELESIPTPEYIPPEPEEITAGPGETGEESGETILVVAAVVAVLVLVIYLLYSRER